MHVPLYVVMHVPLYVVMHVPLYVVMHVPLYVVMHVPLHVVMHVPLYVVMHVPLYIVMHVPLYVVMHVPLYIVMHVTLYIVMHVPLYVVMHVPLYVVMHVPLYACNLARQLLLRICCLRWAALPSIPAHLLRCVVDAVAPASQVQHIVVLQDDDPARPCGMRSTWSCAISNAAHIAGGVCAAHCCPLVRWPSSKGLPK